MNILFFPVFTDNQEMTDHYYRLHWYLYPLRDKIDRITLLSECDGDLSQFPDYLDPYLLELSGKIPDVNIVYRPEPADIEVFINKCDVLLCWKIEPGQPGKIPPSPFWNLIKKKTIFRVDHNAERYAGSFYLKLAELFPDDVKSYESISEEVFAHITEKCRNDKGYIFGTGPGLGLVSDYDFSGGTSIACNSMVRNHQLLERLQPPLIVIADPIFHAGPSTYAAAFRKELVEALDRYNSYLIVPLRDYHIYKTYLPVRFHNRLAGIPYKKQDRPNLDLTKEYYVASTANILTLFLLPLASTFFKNIGVAGCDGRPLDEDSYFWKHDGASQFNDQMGQIKEAHPAFFAINYNDYYLEHCETLDKWLSESEEQGNVYTNMTPSYIPALRDRYTDPRSNKGCLSEIIIMDPDALDHFGHFLSYDDKLNDACAQKDISFSVFGNINCDRNIIDSRPFFEPVFTVHSWTLGNRPNDLNQRDIVQFTEELKKALRLRHQRGLTSKTLLYMYCGSLAVAKIVQEVLEEFDNVSAVIGLFWLSFVDYKSSAYVQEWKEFVQQIEYNDKIILTSPTKRLSVNIEKAFGVSLSVAPHPSTTFSDLEAEDLFNRARGEPVSSRNGKLNILFPGGLRMEKGCYLTGEFAPRIAKEYAETFNITVRALMNSNTPNNIKGIVKCIENSGCTIFSDHLDDNGFARFLNSGDIIVLPYQAPDFSERTSGLVIDALYLGIPVIVWENTWLADIVEEYKNGVVVRGKSYSAFKDALNEVVEQLDYFTVSAKSAQTSYFKTNSWCRFVDSIMQKNSMSINSKTHNNEKFIISNDGKKLYRENKAEIDETKIVAELLAELPPKSMMIDVGAHHGSALAPFHRMDWQVYAFEPDPDNRKYLINRFGETKNIVIDPRAVGECTETGMNFYASNESTGISGMLAFRETHELVDTVDVTTVADIIRDNDIKEVDFLKIDVEGYDFSVLKGVPWDKVKPEVIECEFEDAKTKHLGHTWRDICEYLIEREYTVYVSEWHPIIRYGIRHDWLGLKRYPCVLEDSNAWGNLLAFKNDPGNEAVQKALNKVLKVGRPEKVISVSEAQDTPKTVSKVVPLIKEPVFQSPNSIKQNSKPIRMRRLLPRFSSYANFAEWIQSKNLSLFRIGQFVMWVLRFLKRHPRASVFGLTTMIALVVIPIYFTPFVSYRNYFWIAAGLLMFSAISIMTVSFVNKKMIAFSGQEHRYRQVLRAEMLREQQKRQDQLTQRIEAQDKQQSEFGNSLSLQAQGQDELTAVVDKLKGGSGNLIQSLNQLTQRIEAQDKQQSEFGNNLSLQSQGQDKLTAVVDELKIRSDDLGQSQDQLTKRVETQEMRQVENYDALDSKCNNIELSASVFNFGDYQSFNRRLSQAHVEVLMTEWSRKLGLKVTSRSLAYLAHHICMLESLSKGRLATTIEDVVLRVLVSSAVKDQNLRVLEIGTLFGIGLAAIYGHTSSRFNSIHLTAIDPLDGYYGKDIRDIVTDEIVDEQTFRSNLAVAGIPEQDYTLIKAMSTEDSAIELAANHTYDVLIIDGDHSYAGVKADFVNYLSAVKRGGYVIFDDYGAPDWPDVKKFIDTTVCDNADVAFVGASWRTAVFRVVQKTMVAKL